MPFITFLSLTQFWPILKYFQNSEKKTFFVIFDQKLVQKVQIRENAFHFSQNGETFFLNKMDFKRIFKKNFLQNLLWT